MSQQAVSADIIPNSAVWAPPARAAWVQHKIQGLYTERIDLWFEPFFVKEIRLVIKWLREIKTADQHCYKILQLQQKKNFDSMQIKY